jgi:hypothetical protein
VAQALVEGAGGVLGSEVEQELRRSGEESPRRECHSRYGIVQKLWHDPKMQYPFDSQSRSALHWIGSATHFVPLQ